MPVARCSLPQKLQKTASKLLSLDLGFLLGWTLKLLTWLAVPCLGFVTWYEALKEGPPHPEGLLYVALRDWRMYAIVVATVLVAVNPGGRILGRRARAEEDDGRADFETVALHEARKHLQPKPLKGKKPDKQGRFNAMCDRFKTTWEPTLIAAQLEIERELGLMGDGLIKTNLLLVHDGHFVVVARSRPGSPCPERHAHNDQMPATRALQVNTTVVKCNINRQAGFEKKPYDCAAATPIAQRKQAFGVITVDSPETSTFRGREALLDRILRPYCAQILLTLGDSADYHDCPDVFKR